jgi:hypothetical protein
MTQHPQAKKGVRTCTVKGGQTARSNNMTLFVTTQNVSAMNLFTKLLEERKGAGRTMGPYYQLQPCTLIPLLE